MALRIRTRAGKFCSSCGVAAEAALELCIGCGQPFEGDVMGFVCSRCGHAVEAAAERCPMCNLEFKHLPLDAGRTLPPPIIPQAVASPKPAPAGESPEGIPEVKEAPPPALQKTELSSLPKETEAHLLSELESLWKLSEPLEQVVASRRKRLEQMDRLIAGARRRIRELEESELPEEARERDELKKQLAQVLQERDEILKIEYGITEMERIYRNIITIQQKELKSKEEALKARLDGFRKEVEVRDEERKLLADREKGVVHREHQVDDREKAVAERLAQIEARDKQPAAAFPDRQKEADGVTREEWLSAQREIQQSLFNIRDSDPAGLLPRASTIRDLQVRVSELEESMEKAVEERTRTQQELEEIRVMHDEVRKVLKVLDDLLGQLPDNAIREFARSEAFERYERLMKRLGL